MAEAMFAKAGRGYNREQVDAFLVELNRSFAETEAMLNSRIRELAAELADTNERLKESEAKNLAMEKSYSARLEEKEKECAEMQAAIGQRMLVADARAEEIVSQAQQEANNLLENSRRKAEHDAEKIISETRRACAVIGQAAAEFSGRMNAVTSEMRKTEALMDMALEEVKRKAGIRKA